jgi:hypothetical protein
VLACSLDHLLRWKAGEVFVPAPPASAAEQAELAALCDVPRWEPRQEGQ